MPNLTDRFLQGNTTVGAVRNAGLPNITGLLRGSVTINGGSKNGAISYSTSGAFYNEDIYGAEVAQFSYVALGGTAGSALINASRSSDIYGKSATVQPNAITCLICIKY